MTINKFNKQLDIVYKKRYELIKQANNSRTHSDVQIQQIADSIIEFGWTNPVLIDELNNIIAGHGRIIAAELVDIENIPCIVLSGLTEIQKRAYLIVDNQLALNAGWDIGLLQSEIEALKLDDFDIDLLGFDDDFFSQLEKDIDVVDNHQELHSKMSEKFLIPPFSVFSARDGWWRERKNYWLDFGIKSEVGRGDNLAFSSSSQTVEVYDAKKKYENKVGKTVAWSEFLKENPQVNSLSGTSIFDPVLCEIAYRWFSPENGVILDPFAGGSVRGIVATVLNRQYVGCDLRQEQVSSNHEQWLNLNQKTKFKPVWICGDSKHINEHAKDIEADFIFTCPPYADLEVYSDNPNDLSTMKYTDFIKVYREIISKSLSLLKNNRFACVVVGEVRDKQGNYYNFVSDTIKAFIDSGANYYNEAILVTTAGSLPMRAGKPFKASRKLGKTHQNVLIFVKGDAKLATKACGDIDITMPDITDES